MYVPKESKCNDAVNLAIGQDCKCTILVSNILCKVMHVCNVCPFFFQHSVQNSHDNIIMRIIIPNRHCKEKTCGVEGGGL